MDVLGIYAAQTFWPNITVFFVAFALSAAIAMAGWYGRLHSLIPNHRRAVQNFHLGQTPRLGGASVIIATLGAAVAFFPEEFWSGHRFIILCCMPALFLALLEDLGTHIRPALRLAASFFSAGIYFIVTGDVLPRIGIGFVDEIMTIPTVAILLSICFVAAAVQAMNLIDGLNGLCSGIAFLICVCLALVSDQAQNIALFHVSVVSSIAILGFFVVNFPAGGVFLGDSGAYWLGFSLSLFGIYFLRETVNFAPPAMLLIFFWPAFDIFLAIGRRFLTGRNLFRPDRMHPHHIAVRVLRTRLTGPQGGQVANSLAACVILLLAAPPMAFGVAFWDQPQAAWAALVICGALYPALYVLAVRAARSAMRQSRVQQGAKTGRAGAGCVAPPPHKHNAVRGTGRAAHTLAVAGSNQGAVVSIAGIGSPEAETPPKKS